MRADGFISTCIRRAFAALTIGATFAILLGALTIGSASAQFRFLCLGRNVTVSGTNGADTLFGTAGPDVISVLGGNDIIYGMVGNDIVCGGTGDDRIFGGTSRDSLWDPVGLNQMNGEGGTDSCNNNWVMFGATFSCERSLVVQPQL